MDEATRRIAAIIARDIRGFSILEFSRRYNEPLPEPMVARREMMSGSEQMLANAFLWHPGVRALWEAEPPETRFFEFTARIWMAAGRPES
jgi:hypothetical protein